MTIRDLGRLTTILAVLMAVDSVALPVISWAFRTLHIQRSPETEQWIGVILAALIGLRLLTAATFLRWVYVASVNLVQAGFDDLGFSPARRVCSFLLPIYNLIMPYFAMRELWFASQRGNPNTANAALIGLWWLMWIAGGGLTVLIFRLGPGGLRGWAPYLLFAYWAAQAVIAIVMTRGIATAQRSLSPGDLDEVFG